MRFSSDGHRFGFILDRDPLIDQLTHDCGYGSHAELGGTREIGTRDLTMNFKLLENRRTVLSFYGIDVYLAAAVGSQISLLGPLYSRKTNSASKLAGNVLVPGHRYHLTCIKINY